MVPQTGKGVRDTPTPNVMSPTNTLDKQPYYLFRGPSADSCRLRGCCFSLCEPM